MQSIVIVLQSQIVIKRKHNTIGTSKQVLPISYCTFAWQDVDPEATIFYNYNIIDCLKDLKKQVGNINYIASVAQLMPW